MILRMLTAFAFCFTLAQNQISVDTAGFWILTVLFAFYGILCAHSARVEQ